MMEMVHSQGTTWSPSLMALERWWATSLEMFQPYRIDLGMIGRSGRSTSPRSHTVIVCHTVCHYMSYLAPLVSINLVLSTLFGGVHSQHDHNATFECVATGAR